MTLAQYKKCTGCLKELPATSAFFHRQKNGLYGFTSKCKTCKNAQVKSWTYRNPEKAKRHKESWKRANYPKYLQLKRDDQRRRKYNLKTGKVSVDDWNRMLEFYDHKCVECKSSDDITQHHIIPLSKGGLNVIENIQPLCRSCNSKKSNKIA